MKRGDERSEIQEAITKTGLTSQNTMHKDFIFSFMDQQNNQTQLPQIPKRKMRGTQPTISDQIAGGQA